ncbi:MAG TPA: apolipoprotein N-acyltransferase [Thermohalobaculum sp.]|nr:apolipoprotein N-acyltransferase [Thermohalobaculum sp.]
MPAEGGVERRAAGWIAAWIAAWIADRGRWARLALALAAGAAMTLGQPPLSQPWALFLALPVLVWLIDAAPGPRAAALTGWAAGFGYFVTGLYWIGHAFLVDPERFAWMMPFAVALLPAFLGLFWAAAFALARRLWPVGRWWRPLPLAAALTLAEYVRAHVLTGFPWALPGYVWVETPLMQAAAWVGPFGVTFLTLLVVPLVLLGLAERRRLAGPAALGVLAALWVGGIWRIETTPSEGGGPVLRVVQPNAEQRLKWREDHARIFYERLLSATAAPPDPALGPPVAVIWPETAVPFLPAYQPERRAEIAAAAAGVPVILGALHGERGEGADRFMNAVMTIRSDGSLGERYDKHHLVPFGEYLPYPAVLGPLGFRQLVPQAGFTPGPGPRVMRVAGLPPFSPLVCYEMIFPGEVVPAGERPAWLLQVTNDAWFGSWGGPQQHLAQARIRAIEQGLPVVRAANTGISAAIDAHGRITASLPMHAHGHVDVVLPVALRPTLYARTGDLPAMALVVLGLFLAARLRRGREAPAA